MGVGILVQHPWQNISFDITFSAFPELSTWSARTGFPSRKVEGEYLGLQGHSKIVVAVFVQRGAKPKSVLSFLLTFTLVNDWSFCFFYLSSSLTKILVHPEESLPWGCCVCVMWGYPGGCILGLLLSNLPASADVNSGLGMLSHPECQAGSACAQQLLWEWIRYSTERFFSLTISSLFLMCLPNFQGLP